MKNQSRRNFLAALAATPPVLAIRPVQANENRFSIGIQEYTFNRWLKSGKLDHLDYPALVKKELGITHIEYWNRPFNGKHTDKAYVGELAKRTTGEGMKNVLILVDAGNQLDAADAAERKRAVDEHKGWIDCAAQLKCDAIRVNCRSGGDREENLKNAAEGMGALCDYAKPSGVKVVIEPHGGNSQDPDWLLAAMEKLDRENAGLLPDFNNFGEYDRYDAVEKTLPHAVAVCAKAFDFDEEGNETKTDFFRMLKIVHQSGYSGVISVEFEGHGIDPIEGSRKTKALIERALEAAG
ncbi:MAG: sugar phosphate isomerase/epimerase [Verrucomicrobiales bacterium]|nr:sugar phosphate isomerase/epimerase [Verrucomicrobiales bacterium]